MSIWKYKLSPLEKNLLYASILWHLADGLLGPFFAIYSEKIGKDVLDLSWALAVFYIVSGIMYIVVGRYVDKNKKEKEIMILGYALNTLATFGYIFISTPFQLLILQAIFGLSSALATPTWNKIFAETENENNAGLLWGLNDGTSSIVLGFGVMIGGYIIYLYSFNVLFIIMGSISLWATIVQAQIFKIEASNNQKDYLFSN